MVRTIVLKEFNLLITLFFTFSLIISSNSLLHRQNYNNIKTILNIVFENSGKVCD